MDANFGVAHAVWSSLQWDGGDVPEGDLCGWSGDHGACADGDVLRAKPCTTKGVHETTRDTTGPIKG